VVAGNAALFRWFARVRGWRFAAGTVPLRVLYYVVNVWSAVAALVTHAVRAAAPPRSPRAATSCPSRPS
jgi:hypothetical protein